MNLCGHIYVQVSVSRYALAVKLGVRAKAVWQPEEEITAQAHDQLIPGFETTSTNSLRLWSAHASGRGFGLSDFNRGDYFAAMVKQTARKTSLVCFIRTILPITVVNYAYAKSISFARHLYKILSAATKRSSALV